MQRIERAGALDSGNRPESGASTTLMAAAENLPANDEDETNQGIEHPGRVKYGFRSRAPQGKDRQPTFLRPQ